MMDSYNLAWKLAHEIDGLVPDSTSLLQTYESERRAIAQELIAFDTEFSSMFSGKMGSVEAKAGGEEGELEEEAKKDADADGEAKALTHEQFLEVFSKGNGFTSGCGIEYAEGLLVEHTPTAENPIDGTDYLAGVLRPGRRLLNVKVCRFADSNPRNLQDGTSTSPSYQSSSRCLR